MRLTFENRKFIERELKKGIPITDIAKKLGCHRNTVNFEVHRRGFTRDTYSAKQAQLLVGTGREA